VDALAEYRKLIDSYHDLIGNGEWWAGQRDRLVKQMDVVWGRLSVLERTAAVGYAEECYAKRRKV
jgi:hypothetical protein